MSTMLRAASTTITGIETSDGGGVRLLRTLGSVKLDHLDPFLLLDEIKSDVPDDYLAGFPDHPHRGFETVTYMLHGEMEHKDNQGNSGILRAGSCQWMTAGRGIVHSEIPKQKDGLMWGFQLWVNLPAKLKMCSPRYQDIPPEDIPIKHLESGARVRVVAGTFLDVSGPVSDVVTQPMYLDVTLPHGQVIEVSVPATHNCFAYVYKGRVLVAPHDEEVVERQLVVLGEPQSQSSAPSTTVKLTAAPSQDKEQEAAARFLLVSAEPINEPIARYGPFVMNTRKEIQQALRDFS